VLEVAELQDKVAARFDGVQAAQQQLFLCAEGEVGSSLLVIEVWTLEERRDFRLV
jgi:hypothetical protein